MLKQLFVSRKSMLFTLAGIILIVFLLLVWRVVSLQRVASEVVSEPILKISYCGVEPEELCVLSFGRDAEENLVVNLFVPDRKSPNFYMKIKRITGESVYECERNKEVRTSVFCYGDMVNLQEKMEISLISMEDGHVLAVGSFTLNAILIAAQSPGVPGTFTPMPSLAVDTETVTPTSETPSLTQEPPIVTLTFTPNPSYPNPSYP